MKRIKVKSVKRFEDIGLIGRTGTVTNEAGTQVRIEFKDDSGRPFYKTLSKESVRAYD